MIYIVCIETAYDFDRQLMITGSALRNWTFGNFVNGTRNPAGGPSIYSANFQAITWAQQTAGYLNGQGTPNTTLATAFKTADERLGEFLSVLDEAKALDSTLLLVGSKQGQGPVNPKTLKVIDPNGVMAAAGVPVAFFNGEDGGIASTTFHIPSAALTFDRCISKTRQMLQQRSRIS